MPSQGRILKMTGDWIFPELITEDGQLGIGEASYSGDDAACCDLIRNNFTQFFENFTLTVDLLDEVRLKSFPVIHSQVEQTAISSLKMACEELLAKSESLSAGTFWGKQFHRSTVSMYATINRALMGRSPTEFASTAIKAYEAGFKCCQCSVWIGNK